MGYLCIKNKRNIFYALLYITLYLLVLVKIAGGSEIYSASRDYNPPLALVHIHNIY